MPTKSKQKTVTEPDTDNSDFYDKIKKGNGKSVDVFVLKSKDAPVAGKTLADDKKADKYVRLLKNISEYFKDEKKVISTRRGILSEKMKELKDECEVISLLLQEKMDRVTRDFLVNQNNIRENKILKYESVRDLLESKKDDYEEEVKLAEFRQTGRKKFGCVTISTKICPVKNMEANFSCGYGVLWDLARRCRVCGCTDDDGWQCIEKTGEPCHWVEDDLCSACE